MSALASEHPGVVAVTPVLALGAVVALAVGRSRVWGMTACVLTVAARVLTVGVSVAGVVASACSQPRRGGGHLVPRPVAGASVGGLGRAVHAWLLCGSSPAKPGGIVPRRPAR